MRVKRGVAAHRRHKKFLKMAKGHIGAGHRLYRTARERVERALCFAFRDRKQRKRLHKESRRATARSTAQAEPEPMDSCSRHKDPYAQETPL